jgi:hypothetical protein
LAGEDGPDYAIGDSTNGRLDNNSYDETAKSVSNSFRRYGCELEELFVADFVASQPDLGILAAILGGLGLISLQTKSARQRFLQAMKRAFAEQLPKIAEEYTPTVHQLLQKCFDA